MVAESTNRKCLGFHKILMFKMSEVRIHSFAAVVGEPPICMSCSALFAVKAAVRSARAEIGKSDNFVLSEWKMSC